MNKEGFMRLLVTKHCTFVSCIYQLVYLLEKELLIIVESNAALNVYQIVHLCIWLL